jgi:hypothetical protein
MRVSLEFPTGEDLPFSLTEWLRASQVVSTG